MLSACAWMSSSLLLIERCKRTISTPALPIKAVSGFGGGEFSDFEGIDNEEALLHGSQIGENRARLFYRFRPKRLVRERIAAKPDTPISLSLEDFSWELMGGGNPAIDLTEIEWNHENEAIKSSPVSLKISVLLGGVSSCPAGR